MGTTVVVWNGRPPSPAGAFSAGRPSADAGLSANNGTPATGSFLNQLKVSFGTKKKEKSLALETDITDIRSTVSAKDQACLLRTKVLL